ncbi:hypothetical protein KLEB273_gp197 [Bacillus phage vB_BauM_KLEB27-3]|nr:hypothetical protein KLEB273_gp197 [Bacillus phage vB_BauM_KLEB27-3]
MNDLELFRKKSNHIAAYLNFLREMKDLTTALSHTQSSDMYSISLLDEYELNTDSFLEDLPSFFEQFPNSNEDHDNQIKNSFKHLLKMIFPGSRINENKNSLSLRIVDEKIISALKAIELIRHEESDQNNKELIRYLEEHHANMYSTYCSLKRMIEDAASAQFFSLKTKEHQDSLLFYIHIPFKSHLINSYDRRLTTNIVRNLTLTLDKAFILSQYEEVYTNIVGQYEDHINKKIQQMNQQAIDENNKIISSYIKKDLSNEALSVRSYITENFHGPIYKEVDSSNLIVPGLNINILSKNDPDGSRKFMMLPVGYNDELPEGFEYEKSQGVPVIASITSVEEFIVENGIEYAKVIIGSIWAIKIETAPFKSLLPDNYQESLDQFNEVYQEALRSSNEDQDDSTETESTSDDTSKPVLNFENSLYDLIKKQIDEQKKEEHVETPSVESEETDEYEKESYRFFKSRLEYLSGLDDTLEFFSNTNADYSHIKDGIYFVNNNLHAFVKDPLDKNRQYFMKISSECGDPIKYLKVILGMQTGVHEVPVRFYTVTHFHEQNRIYSII